MVDGNGVELMFHGYCAGCGHADLVLRSNELDMSSKFEENVIRTYKIFCRNQDICEKWNKKLEKAMSYMDPSCVDI